MRVSQHAPIVPMGRFFEVLLFQYLVVFVLSPRCGGHQPDTSPSPPRDHRGMFLRVGCRSREFPIDRFNGITEHLREDPEMQRGTWKTRPPSRLGSARIRPDPLAPLAKLGNPPGFGALRDRTLNLCWTAWWAVCSTIRCLCSTVCSTTLRCCSTVLILVKQLRLLNRFR